MQVRHGIAIMIVIGAIVVGIGTLAGPYSDGHRDGIVQKFSKKGLIIKSYEGDLALPGSSKANIDSIGNVWHFSVTDPGIAAKINALPPGQGVRLHYVQYYIISGLTTETGYIVDAVQVID